jgi:hypothetical protein
MPSTTIGDYTKTVNEDRHIDEVQNCILARLLECWSQTGFGETTIESERYSAEKIRVIVKGSVHEQFYISIDEVRERLAERRALVKHC